MIDAFTFSSYVKNLFFQILIIIIISHIFLQQGQSLYYFEIRPSLVNHLKVKTVVAYKPNGCMKTTGAKLRHSLSMKESVFFTDKDTL